MCQVGVHVSVQRYNPLYAGVPLLSPATPSLPSLSGGKVVVLSSWERMLEFAATALTEQKWGLAVLRTKDSPEARQEQLDRFKGDAGVWGEGGRRRGCDVWGGENGGAFCHWRTDSLIVLPPSLNSAVYCLYR